MLEIRCKAPVERVVIALLIGMDDVVGVSLEEVRYSETRYQRVSFEGSELSIYVTVAAKEVEMAKHFSNLQDKNERFIRYKPKLRHAMPY